jgi:hypothetical protein
MWYYMVYYIVTCRPITREQVDNHVSLEMDSWKPTINRTTFSWIRVINKYFFGFQIEDIFSVGPSLRYITGASQISS